MVVLQPRTYAESSIKPSKQILLRPLKAVGVKALGVLGSFCAPFSRAQPPRIIIIQGSPMHRRADDIVAKRILLSIVAPRFHDVDLSAAWPVSIHRVLGHHPDGRPHPVSGWQLGYHLNSAVLDCLLTCSGEAGGAYGVDDLSTCSIASCPAGVVVGEVGESLVAVRARPVSSGSGQIHDVATSDQQVLLITGACP
jgi:hypothetical protein